MYAYENNNFVISYIYIFENSEHFHDVNRVFYAFENSGYLCDLERNILLLTMHLKHFHHFVHLVEK